jgi:hypothetical protein
MSSERLREFHEHVNFQGFAGPESSITAFAYANGREWCSLYDPQVSLGHDRSLAYLAWIGCPPPPTSRSGPRPAPARHTPNPTRHTSHSRTPVTPHRGPGAIPRRSHTPWG